MGCAPTGPVLQVVHRPGLRGKTPGCRGLYLQPPERAIVFSFDDESDPGPGSHAARPPAEARARRHVHPRLQAPWHDDVCGPRCGHRPHHSGMMPKIDQEFLKFMNTVVRMTAKDPTSTSSRQLRHAQTSQGETVAPPVRGSISSPPPVLAQSCRTVLQRTRRAPTAAPRRHQRREWIQAITDYIGSQRRPQTFHLDSHRPPDPQKVNRTLATLH